MAAGHETTASGLVWAVYELARQLTIAQRLRTEIETLYAQNSTPGYSDIEGLRYLSNFTREVLRRYPPSVSAPREANEDVIIQGVPIRKGTTIMLVPACLNRNERIWGEDAEAFDPNRWDRLEGKPAADAQAFQTFTWGPKGCIGQVFARLELKIVLVELVRNFDFEIVGDKDRKIELLTPSPLMRPKGGLMIKAKRVGKA
jgi:cytochrome P450